MVWPRPPRCTWHTRAAPALLPPPPRNSACPSLAGRGVRPTVVCRWPHCAAMSPGSAVPRPRELTGQGTRSNRAPPACRPRQPDDSRRARESAWGAGCVTGGGGVPWLRTWDHSPGQALALMRLSVTPSPATPGVQGRGSGSRSLLSEEIPLAAESKPCVHVSDDFSSLGPFSF